MISRLLEDRWVVAGLAYREQKWMRSWIARNCGTVARVTPTRRLGDHGGKN